MAATEEKSSSQAFWFRGGLTLIIVAMVFYSLCRLYGELRVPATPTDSFSRAKDVFVIVFPVMTSIVAFWFGADAKDRADSRADQARQTLLDAVKNHPEAFKNSSEPNPQDPRGQAGDPQSVAGDSQS